MDTPTNSPVRFGVFELDARAGELRRSGRRVALQPQPLEVLRALIERPGEVVTREELRRRVWSNGAYVDFDRSLTKAIVKLRDALGDDADSPRYIETLPRHGYRFIPLPEAQAHVDGAPRADGASTAVMPHPEGPASPQPSPVSSVRSAGTRYGWPWSAVGLTLLALAAWLIGNWFRAGSGPSQSALPAKVAGTSAVAFSPPPRSIAVLPFVNISGDKEQEYFSDGLTEELLNSLAHIDGLQVAARTSSFSFREQPDIADVAHKLNVATVLEGSVRRSGNTMRITAQLSNAVTGFHLWSETYDRDLGDVLKLQTEIATAVASALKVALLGDQAAKIEVGGTHNPAALDAYLRAAKSYWSGVSQSAVTGYTEAIRLDPDYALAYAARAMAFNFNAAFLDTTTSAIRSDLEKAQADAAKGIALAPDLSEGYLARAYVYRVLLEFRQSNDNFERALALAPGNARVLRDYGTFAVNMGHSDSGLSAVRRAVVLDPLNQNSYSSLGDALLALRRYPEALAAFKEANALPSTTANPFSGPIGTTYYLLGDFESARATCEQIRDTRYNQLCLALVYDKLGRHADAEAELKKIQTASGDSWIYQCAAIYAQWGDRPKALEWLDTAMRLRDSDLEFLKTDPLMDPLRKEPRFQAAIRELKFPD